MWNGWVCLSFVNAFTFFLFYSVKRCPPEWIQFRERRRVHSEWVWVDEFEHIFFLLQLINMPIKVINCCHTPKIAFFPRFSLSYSSTRRHLLFEDFFFSGIFCSKSIFIHSIRTARITGMGSAFFSIAICGLVRHKNLSINYQFLFNVVHKKRKRKKKLTKATKKERWRTNFEINENKKNEAVEEERSFLGSFQFVNSWFDRIQLVSGPYFMARFGLHEKPKQNQEEKNTPQTNTTGLSIPQTKKLNKHERSEWHGPEDHYQRVFSSLL